MDRKAELKRLAKEIKTEGGVYQIKNTRNGKVFVESTRNFKTLNGQQFQLQTGGWRCWRSRKRATSTRRAP